MSFKHDLGDRVKSRIDGFQGIIVARSEHLNMCNRYTVQPESLGEHGKPQDPWYIDEQDLIVIEKNVHASIPERAMQDAVAPGGPRERHTHDTTKPGMPAIYGHDHRSR